MLALKCAPRMKAWCDVMDDLSGINVSEDSWIKKKDLENSEAHKLLFSYINDVYLPFLLANANALKAGEKEFSVELKGLQWKQNTFPYQAKCLKQLYSTR